MPANKFSAKQKLKYVQYHLKTGSYLKMEGIKESSCAGMTRNWVKMYKLYGFEGLKPKDKRVKYTFKQKCEAVKLVKSGKSYSEVANSMGMNMGSTVGAWYHIYLKKGYIGLKYIRHFENDGKNIKISKCLVKKYIHNAEKIEGLLEEFKKCKAENIYLKKIYALIPKK